LICLAKEIYDENYDCKIISKMLQLFGDLKFNMIVMTNFFLGK